MFVTDGDSRLLARTATAHGYRRDPPSADLRRPLLAWGTMYRYSNLTWRRRRLPERRWAVAIYGPTSSGKTALSIDVCEAASERGLRPVVLNADSRQDGDSNPFPSPEEGRQQMATPLGIVKLVIIKRFKFV